MTTNVGRFYHHGQKYGSNEYFDYHVLGVMSLLNPSKFDNTHKIVAVLHDVLEDTKCPDDLIIDCFGVEIYDAVVAMTRDHHIRHSPNVPRETYEEYLERLAKNPIATIVKIHDATFNMREFLKEGRMDKVVKYSKAITYLIDKMEE